MEYYTMKDYTIEYLYNWKHKSLLSGLYGNNENLALCDVFVKPTLKCGDKTYSITDFEDILIHDSGIYVLSADAGMGKTAAISYIVSNLKESEVTVMVYKCVDSIENVSKIIENVQHSTDLKSKCLIIFEDLHFDFNDVSKIHSKNEMSIVITARSAQVKEVCDNSCLFTIEPFSIGQVRELLCKLQLSNEEISKSISFIKESNMPSNPLLITLIPKYVKQGFDHSYFVEKTLFDSFSTEAIQRYTHIASKLFDERVELKVLGEFPHVTIRECFEDRYIYELLLSILPTKNIHEKIEMLKPLTNCPYFPTNFLRLFYSESDDNTQSELLNLLSTSLQGFDYIESYNWIDVPSSDYIFKWLDLESSLCLWANLIRIYIELCKTEKGVTPFDNYAAKIHFKRIWAIYKSTNPGIRFDFSALDFQDFDFSNLDLSFVDFSYCNFQNCKFSNCKFNNTVLSNANVANSLFSDCMILNSSFSESNLYETLFESTVIKHSNFESSNLRLTDMTDCVLNDISFEKSNICGVAISNCVGIDTLLKYTNIDTVKVANTVLENLSFDEAHIKNIFLDNQSNCPQITDGKVSS